MSTVAEFEARAATWRHAIEEDAAATAMLEGAQGVVTHGADANVARPTEFAVVQWIGSVEPTNAVDNDLYVPTE